MKQITVAAMVLLLSGCLGTKFLEPEVDTQAGFPSLHSVPRRPKPKNFSALRKEQHAMEINRGSASRAHKSDISVPRR